MINILIVDDSEAETAILKSILENEPDMQIIACAKNGKEAIDYVARYNPDLITMDIIMPIMDGFEATRVIMATNPKPIVMISSVVNDEVMNTTFQALEAGALSVIDKPVNVTSPEFEAIRIDIIETIRGMAEIKVVVKHLPLIKKIFTPELNIEQRNFDIIAIGASVGGTQALKTILSNLPIDFPIPIVIVQHMTKGFIASFAKWLDHELPIKIKEAEHHEPLEKGIVYLAPDNYHLEVVKKNNALYAELRVPSTTSNFCPSITTLFESVAKASGKQGIGILLTGMGSDGASGLLEIKKAQGHTLIQDEKSAVVFGMGAVAQSMGAVDRMVELHKMADYLKKIIRGASPKSG